METKELIEWLRGYGTAKECLGNDAVADMILMAADRLEQLEDANNRRYGIDDR